MARRFLSGQFINHGSAAGIDDLPTVSGGFGAWLWVLRLSNGNNQHILTKDNSVSARWDFLVVNSPGEGSVEFTLVRATTNPRAVSVAGVVPLGTWTFVAFDYDDAASPEVRLFAGGIGTAVSEVTYNTQTDGAGAYTSEAAASLYVGNLQRATTNPFLGLIQRGGIIKGSRPGASGFETIRAATVPSVSSNPSLADMLAAATHEFAFDYQDGDVTDRTGNGHNGTVTGATALELLTPFGLFEGVSIPMGSQPVIIPPFRAVGY